MNDPSVDNSASIIQTAWKDEQCAMINGIVWGSGLMKLLDIDFIHDSKGSIYVINAVKEMDAGELKKSGLLELTDIIQLAELFENEKGIRISCGEGGWGGEGFVAVSRIEGDYLIWIAFFDVSNPFVKISFHENEIFGVTNLGNTWKFPVDAPDRLKVV